ncbi:hypothetical protein [Paenibacillus sp. IHBB 3054]|uniref:hypothetical protein n=1 Tax=Paenibacillus sp. IHBB 3054 TaxID=3425689 RepID=UPI003F672840
MEASISQLPEGAVQMAAYLDAIHQADLARNRYWRLRFRYRYACEATFRDDLAKAMPMAAQFAFYLNIDREKAIQYFQKFWMTECDDLSDCMACEQSYAVMIFLLMGDRKAADEYARPLEEGSIKLCHDAPLQSWLAYLEDALDRGDLKDAAASANALYRQGNGDKSELSYIGAVLRYFAFTDLNRAVGLLTKRLEWTFDMWDRQKVYDFYKGAWGC